MSGFDVKALRGLTADSRKVEPGFLFAALPGGRHDGRTFIADAVQAGATHVLALPGTAVPEGIELVADKNPRRRLAVLAAAFYGDQPETVVAVTGTNGKTSVVHFVNQMWRRLGLNSAMIGTLSGAMTTPDPVALHRELAAMARQSIRAVAMEASSHGLDQYRLDGVRLTAAGFTNISHDHLDYHGSFEKYLAAKTRLFSEVLPEEARAVLNADTPQFPDLKAKSKGSVVSYGAAGEHLRLLSATSYKGVQEIRLRRDGEEWEIALPLIGGFQVMNVLCALGLVLATSQNPGDIHIPDLLETLESVPGRLQDVPGHPAGAQVYVDYAHTPQALETVLTTLRPHTRGRLICVFGCGGDRDTEKRPVMGAVARHNADVVIVTDDNPRSEDPAAIRASILKAAPEAAEIGDRREAILKAVALAGPEDVVLIAGKGHETGQEIAGKIFDFKDFNEVQFAYEKLKKGETS